ncbi:roadblock/LC7 domain-containing protein [Dactylosporangium sp. NPDC049525]|uniref:roadblock/LC7 domain-containing protein n=1 Tax=Dactylosporangium sp. NPDC049525 TaxID=3154730 RepID=UPI003434446C
MTATTGLDCVLSGFTERVAGVRHTVAVSGDGLLVAASNELPPERADQLAAMVAGVVSLAQGLSACTDAGPVVRTIVSMGRSLLFVMALGDGHTLASLAAMVQPGCDVGEVAFEMTGLVDQLGAALTPATRL